MMVLLFLIVLQLSSVVTVAVGSIISMPNCVDHCGGIKIPYPFGIGANCYRDRSFEIICNSSFSSHKPFLRELNLEVLNIVWPKNGSESQAVTVGLPRPTICETDGALVICSHDLKGSAYLFSSNVLMMQGCGVSAVVKDRSNRVVAGCASVGASAAANLSGTTCYGVKCCREDISDGLDYYEIAAFSEQPLKSDNHDTLVVVLDSGSVQNLPGSLASVEIIPTTLFWNATYAKPFEYVRKANVSCSLHSCVCQVFYEGYPNVPYGCQVVNECTKCKGRCGVGYHSSKGSQYFYCKKNPLFTQAPFLDECDSALGSSMYVGDALYGHGHWELR